MTIQQRQDESLTREGSKASELRGLATETATWKSKTSQFNPKCRKIRKVSFKGNTSKDPLLSLCHPRRFSRPTPATSIEATGEGRMPRDTWPVGIAGVCHSGSGCRSHPNKDAMLPPTTNNTILRRTAGWGVSSSEIYLHKKKNWGSCREAEEWRNGKATSLVQTETVPSAMIQLLRRASWFNLTLTQGQVLRREGSKETKMCHWRLWPPTLLIWILSNKRQEQKENGRRWAHGAEWRKWGYPSRQ